jgi:hypothetical protein
MGLVKLTTNNVVQAEGILQLTAAISSNTLTIDVLYALDMGSSKLAKANIVYTKGASNSFTKTEAEYLELFASSFGNAMGTSGPALVGPIVEQKVAATGVLVGTITPVVTLKLSSALT